MIRPDPPRRAEPARPWTIVLAIWAAIVLSLLPRPAQEARAPVLQAQTPGPCPA